MAEFPKARRWLFGLEGLERSDPSRQQLVSTTGDRHLPSMKQAAVLRWQPPGATLLRMQLTRGSSRQCRGAIGGAVRADGAERAKWWDKERADQGAQGAVHCEPGLVDGRLAGEAVCDDRLHDVVCAVRWARKNRAAHTDSYYQDDGLGRAHHEHHLHVLPDCWTAARPVQG